MPVISAVCWPIAVAGAPVAGAVIDTILESVLARGIYGIAAITTAIPAAVITITLAVPVTIAIAAGFPKSALITGAVCLAVITLTPPAVVRIKTPVVSGIPLP